MSVHPADELFSPVLVSGRTMPSRVLLAPINTGFAEDGCPTDDLLRFHEARSGPAIGVSIVGNVAIAESAVANIGTAVLDRKRDLAPYTRIASVIRSRGSLAGIQLASSPVLQARRNWVATNVEAERQRLTDLLQEFSDTSLEIAIDQFVDATRLAASAGFDVIQLHAAHGYLLSLLLNPLVNLRQGRFALFGPWLTKFLQRFVAAGAGCVLSIRITLFSGLASGFDDEIVCVKELSRRFCAAGIHVIDYSAGFYTLDRRLVYPGVEKGTLPYLSIALDVAQGLDCLFGVSGNVSDLRILPTLPSNCVVSVGRSLIADAEFVEKARVGKHDHIVKCRRTGRCHYFSRGKWTIECGANPKVAGVLEYE